MKTIKNMHSQRGLALVALLFFVIVALTITTATVFITLTHSLLATKVEVSSEALAIAETGMENALLRLLRDPGYAGESLTVGTGRATVVVSGSNPKTVVSIGTLDNFERTVQAEVNITDDILTFNSWKEIY